MKLNPPASSSDIEVAREIARRLNQRRRRDDRSSSGAGAAPREEPPAPPKRLTPPPLPPRLAQPRPEPAELPAVQVEEPSALFEPRFEAARQEPARPQPPPRPEPQRVEQRRVDPPRPEPKHLEAPLRPAPPPRVQPRAPAPEPEPEFDPEEPPAFQRSAWTPEALEAEMAANVATPEPEDDGPLGALAASPPPAAFRAPANDPAFMPEEAAIDVDDGGLSPEQMVGGDVEEASPLDQLTEPEPSPFDEGLLDEPAVVEEPVGPSWEDIVETCRGLAQASGAMLVDPAGQVFAARGDWPTPGPNAIATKLVAMMEKTLKDAPTRSISAPLMGMHLTAWRVQLSEGLITVAFIGKAPVKADARPVIDNEIHHGTGA